jgi:hypothetical protein
VTTTIINEHCVPRLAAHFTKSVEELRLGGFENWASANSSYADDPRSITALVGNIDTFERGFTDFNGKPVIPDDLMAQMQNEFVMRATRSLRPPSMVASQPPWQEWEFAVAPVEGKAYPDECGLPRAGHLEGCARDAGLQVPVDAR